MSTMTTTSEQKTAEDLSDELLEIESRTVGDRYVRAEVTSVRARSKDQVRLKAKLPNGETPRWDLDKPVPWNQSFLFARLAESKGYEPGSIHYLVGDEILVKPGEDSGWEIVDPWDWKKRAATWISGHPVKSLAGVVAIAAAIALLVSYPMIALVVIMMIVMLGAMP